MPVLTLGPLADAASDWLLDSLPSAPTSRARLEVLQQAGGSPLARLPRVSPAVRKIFQPLLELAHDRPIRPDDVTDLSGLAMDARAASHAQS